LLRCSRHNNDTGTEDIMLKALAKLTAYSRAPKRTFAFLHPLRAIKWGAGLFLLKKLWDGIRDRREAAD
jgi:hypothetical protein